MTNIFEQDVASAVEVNDVRETTTFEERIIPEGPTLGRLINYVEYGMTEMRLQQGEKEPKKKRVAQFVFELVGAKNTREIEKDDGTKVTIFDKIKVFDLPVSTNEKSNYKKLFDAMAAGNTDIGSFLAMIGQPFLMNVIHSKSEDGKKTYFNIRDKNGWKIGAAVKVDALAGTSEAYKVGPGSGEQRAFVWDAPSQIQWDSIFIDGTYEAAVWKDGKKTDETETKSKNWMQERIMSALDWDASPMAAFLDLGGLDLPTEELELIEEVIAAVDELETQEEPAPKKAKGKAKKEEPTEEPALELPDELSGEDTTEADLSAIGL